MPTLAWYIKSRISQKQKQSVPYWTQKSSSVDYFKPVEKYNPGEKFTVTPEVISKKTTKNAWFTWNVDAEQKIQKWIEIARMRVRQWKWTATDLKNIAHYDKTRKISLNK